MKMMNHKKLDDSHRNMEVSFIDVQPTKGKLTPVNGSAKKKVRILNEIQKVFRI